jgi:hypothetical protein
MKSPTVFRVESSWTPAERKVARRAFRAAYTKQCATIAETAKRMLAPPTPPEEIWQLHNYLSRERKNVDLKYDYRYSVLISVFAQLLREGWLKMADLEGLDADKIEQITYRAEPAKS